jgi:hypothetical protein
MTRDKYFAKYQRYEAPLRMTTLESIEEKRTIARGEYGAAQLPSL